jgi:hypothetical protein
MPYISFYGANTPPASGGTSDKWRILISETQNATSWPSINEMEMRATSGGADQCNGGTASASSTNPDPPGSETRPASSAFDDNFSTLWQGSTSARPQWLEYDFLSPVTVTEVSMTADNISVGPNGCPKTFDIQHWDGTDWVTEWSVADSGTWTAGETKVFTKP